MMKKSLSIVSTLAVATVLMFSSAAFAQGSGTTGGTTGGDGGSTGTTSSTGTTTRNDDQREDDGPDLGWLGLLGLAGLAGLLKKPERHVVHQTDVPRTTPVAR